MTPEPPISDLEFVRQLRAIVDRYLRAIDHWESEYKKFYRMPGTANRVTPDLEAAHREFLDAHNAYKSAAPRAQRIGRRYGAHDPWAGLLRVNLGLDSPQMRAASAIGRNERNTISECLVYLEHACAEPATAKPDQVNDPERPSLVRRLLDFFT